MPWNATDFEDIEGHAPTGLKGKTNHWKASDFEDVDYAETTMQGDGISDAPDSMDALGVAVKSIPGSMVKTLIGTFNRGKGADIVNPGWADRLYQRISEKQESDIAPFREAGGEVLPGLPDTALVEAGQGLGYPFAAAAGGIAGAALASPVPVPGARVAGGLGGSYLFTQGASEYDAMLNFLHKADALKKDETGGEGITAEEQEQLKGIYGISASKIANWDSGVEAISTVIEMAMYGIGGKYLPEPVKKQASSMIMKLVQGKLATSGAKAIGTLVTETAEEVISSIGGGNVEREFWGEDKQKWDIETAAKTAKEVFPTVLFTGGAIHGAGTVAGGIKKFAAGQQLSDENLSAIQEHFGDAGIALAQKSPRAAKRMLDKVGVVTEPTQQPQQKVFAGQLTDLSDRLQKSTNIEADLNTAIGLHSKLEGDPESQEALDIAILDGLSQGVADGTINPDILAEIKASVPEENPLSGILDALDLPEPVSPVVAEAPVKPDVVAEIVKPTEPIVDEEKEIFPKMTLAERQQKRISAMQKKQPSEVVGEYFPEGTTALLPEIEALLAEKKTIAKADQERIAELSKGQLTVPLDIDIEMSKPEDKYIIEGAYDLVDRATEKLGGKVVMQIVDKNGLPVTPAKGLPLSVRAKKDIEKRKIEKTINQKVSKLKLEALGVKDRERISALKTIAVPLDIDFEASKPLDKYIIESANNLVDKATDRLGGKVAMQIVDRHGRPIEPAGVPALSIRETKNRLAGDMENYIQDEKNKKKVVELSENQSFQSWEKSAKNKYWKPALTEDEVFEMWRQTANRLDPKILIMSDKPRAETQAFRSLNQIEKEIKDRWAQAKTLPAGKKKSQIANEITALNTEMERAM
nr:hypothetical protein [Desulfobacterales bacterium]